MNTTFATAITSLRPNQSEGSAAHSAPISAPSEVAEVTICSWPWESVLPPRSVPIDTSTDEM